MQHWTCIWKKEAFNIKSLFETKGNKVARWNFNAAQKNQISFFSVWSPSTYDRCQIVELNVRWEKKMRKGSIGSSVRRILCAGLATVGCGLQMEERKFSNLTRGSLQKPVSKEEKKTLLCNITDRCSQNHGTSRRRAMQKLGMGVFASKSGQGLDTLCVLNDWSHKKGGTGAVKRHQYRGYRGFLTGDRSFERLMEDRDSKKLICWSGEGVWISHHRNANGCDIYGVMFRKIGIKFSTAWMRINQNKPTPIDCPLLSSLDWKMGWSNLLLNRPFERSISNVSISHFGDTSRTGSLECGGAQFL